MSSKNEQGGSFFQFQSYFCPFCPNIPLCWYNDWIEYFSMSIEFSFVQILTICLLAEMSKGKSSWWHPYLMQLPRSYDTLANFSQFEKQALQVWFLTKDLLVLRSLDLVLLLVFLKCLKWFLGGWCHMGYGEGYIEGRIGVEKGNSPNGRT